jgi:hypothetical protein
MAETREEIMLLIEGSGFDGFVFNAETPDEPLTPETFRRGMTQIANLPSRGLWSVHHPDCPMVKTGEFPDCRCGGGWL